MKINIIQNKVPHYRIPLFNALVNKLEWCVEVFHSGPSVAGDIRSWHQTIVPRMEIGAVSLQRLSSKSMRQADANIVMFDLHWPVGIVAGLKMRREAPIIWWGHGLGRRAIGRAIRLHLVRAGHGMIVYGPAAESELRRRGVPAHKVTVAPNTVWLDHPEDTSAELATHFIFVGRLQDRKRLGDLIKAFATIHASVSLDLLIVGDGPCREQLERVADKCRLHGRVKFLGSILNEVDLRELFRRSLAYVSPGSVGLGVLHAFGYGVPVVTALTAGHGPEREWVRDGETGLLTDGSIDGLADEMLKLSANRELAAQLGRNAYMSYCNDVAPDKMVQGFHEAVRLAVRGDYEFDFKT